MHKVVFIADPHIGGEHRWGISAERYDAPLREVFQYAKDNDVDLVVIAGDTFDKRNPTTEEWQRFDLIVGAYQGHVLNVEGNHDVGVAEESVSTTIMSQQFGLRGFIHPAILPMIFELNRESPQIVALPWPRPVDYGIRSYGNLDEQIEATRLAVMAKLQELCDALDPNRPAVLTGHCMMSHGTGPGFMAGKDVVLRYEDLAALPNIQGVYMGHVHQSEVEGYIGSTQPVDITDDGPKGFRVVTFDDLGLENDEFIPYTTSLKVARLQWKGFEDGSAIVYPPVEAADIVRLEVTVPNDSTVTEQQIRDCYANRDIGSLIIQIKREVIERVRVEGDVEVAQMAPDEAFDMWLKVNEIDEEQAARVREMFLSVVVGDEHAA